MPLQSKMVKMQNVTMLNMMMEVLEIAWVVV